jgi:uncharacterized membrane protein
MKIVVDREESLDKVLAFLRGRARGTFVINTQLMSDLLQKLSEYAKEKSVNIRLVFRDGPNLYEVLITASGAFIGACLGFILLGVPGIVIGSAIGAVAAYRVAHEMRFSRVNEVEMELVLA